MTHPTRFQIVRPEREPEVYLNMYRAMRAYEESDGQRTLQACAGDWTIDLMSALF